MNLSNQILQMANEIYNFYFDLLEYLTRFVIKLAIISIIDQLINRY